MTKKKVLIVVLVVLISVVSLFSMKFDFNKDKESISFEKIGADVIMEGVITSNTPEKLEKLIENNPDIKRIIMKNVPGSIEDDANLIASRLIRKNNIDTFVPKDGLIASGGVDFFCAGVNRVIEKGAKVGVHSWADDITKDASKLPVNHVEHKKYIDYYKDMGIPKDFYFFTINAATSDNIYMMKYNEIKKYKLIN